MARPTRRSFTPEQKLDAVHRLLRGEQLTKLARELGVDHTTLYRWREQAQKASLSALATGGKATETEALERQVADLQRVLGQKTLELEILGKASRLLA